jgi:hypothetical protein
MRRVEATPGNHYQPARLGHRASLQLAMRSGCAMVIVE